MSTAESGSQIEPEIERVFREAADPVLTAVEVAERLGISQQGAHKKLTRAHEQGNVKRKKTGARSVVWWIDGYDEDSR